ncbi:MAG: AI-2E family transporter [Clostridium sp.]|nr:AI-2E family transporter [Clostridium sp.]
MKINYDKKLFNYSMYVIFTVIAIFIAIKLMSNIGLIFKTTISLLEEFFLLIRPLLIALIISYLLYPITKYLEKVFKDNKIFKIKKESNRRILSILLSYVLVIGLIFSLICGIYFMIGGQLSKNTTIINIISDINNYINSNSFSSSTIPQAIKSLNIPLLNILEPYIIDIITSIQNYLISNLGDMTASIMYIGSSIASFLIALVLSIYLLKDSEYFINLWNKLYYLIFRKSKAGIYTKKIFFIIHDVFSKFIRGQLLEAFFVGALSSIALSIVGIDYAIVIGIIAGICNMIPYVGPIIGTILAAIMGLLSGRPIKILYAIIAMLIVQQIDNNLLAPKIVGESVGLHAVFTMLAIIIGGNVFGLIGMLIAVPLVASFRILFNLWYEKKINQI